MWFNKFILFTLYTTSICRPSKKSGGCLCPSANHTFGPVLDTRSPGKMILYIFIFLPVSHFQFWSKRKAWSTIFSSPKENNTCSSVWGTFRRARSSCVCCMHAHSCLLLIFSFALACTFAFLEVTILRSGAGKSHVRVIVLHGIVDVRIFLCLLLLPTRSPSLPYEVGT